MSSFKFLDRDLLPIVSVSFVFGIVGLGAVIALATMPGPQMSLVALLP